MFNSPSRFSFKWIAAALALAAIAGWFGWQAFFPDRAAPQTTFVLLSGERLESQALTGQVVIVNFWATSCPTCIKEMPDMVKTYEQYRPQGLEFVAVSMAYDPPMYVKNFVETRKLPFKVAMDADGSVARAFGDVQLTPTTFVLDKRGYILKQYVGEPDWADFHTLIHRALTENI